MSELMDSARRVVSPGVLSLLVGLGIGFAVESHTDTVAKGKVNTVETCKKIAPLGAVITEEFDKCIEEGVPNGHKVGDKKIKVGQPIAFLDAYETAQRDEQGLELDRIALWGVAGAVLEAHDLLF